MAGDSIGMNEVEVPENDIYIQLRDQAKEDTRELRAQITYWTLNGTAENNSNLRSVSTGKMNRVG